MTAIGQAADNVVWLKGIIAAGFLSTVGLAIWIGRKISKGGGGAGD